MQLTTLTEVWTKKKLEKNWSTENSSLAWAYLVNVYLSWRVCVLFLIDVLPLIGNCISYISQYYFKCGMLMCIGIFHVEGMQLSVQNQLKFAFIVVFSDQVSIDRAQIKMSSLALASFYFPFLMPTLCAWFFFLLT